MLGSKISIALILAGSFWATSAGAQTTDTTCSTYGNRMNCQTTQQRDIYADFNRTIERQNAEREANDRQEKIDRQRNALVQQAAEQREVWIRCRKKWNEAIEARDFDLANALAQGCPAKP